MNTRTRNPEEAAVPVDLIASRVASARDDLDAERWLDEDGAYSAAVVVELRAPRQASRAIRILGR
jgi:hypothetical protein